MTRSWAKSSGDAVDTVYSFIWWWKKGKGQCSKDKGALSPSGGALASLQEEKEGPPGRERWRVQSQEQTVLSWRRGLESWPGGEVRDSGKLILSGEYKQDRATRGIGVSEDTRGDCGGGKIMEDRNIRWGRKKPREVREWEGTREQVSRGLDIWASGPGGKDKAGTKQEQVCGAQTGVPSRQHLHSAVFQRSRCGLWWHLPLGDWTRVSTDTRG